MLVVAASPVLGQDIVDGPGEAQEAVDDAFPEENACRQPVDGVVTVCNFDDDRWPEYVQADGDHLSAWDGMVRVAQYDNDASDLILVEARTADPGTPAGPAEVELRAYCGSTDEEPTCEHVVLLPSAETGSSSLAGANEAFAMIVCYGDETDPCTQVTSTSVYLDSERLGGKHIAFVTLFEGEAYVCVVTPTTGEVCAT